MKVFNAGYGMTGDIGGYRITDSASVKVATDDSQVDTANGNSYRSNG
jgi:hypothetical protein